MKKNKNEKQRLDTIYRTHYKTIAGWNECPVCHKVKQGLMNHKGNISCRDCIEQSDKVSRCRYSEYHKRTDVQIKRCIRKLKKI